MEYIKLRQSIEKRILTQFVKDALASNKRLAVSLERGYDLDEMLLGSTNKKAILAAALAGDDCHIFVQATEGPTSKDGQVVSEGWVYFVWGNDGFDCISDYTTNLEKLLMGANQLASKIEETL